MTSDRIHGSTGVGETTGRRERTTRRSRAGLLVTLLVAALVVAAAVWAYYANVIAARPAMDMNMRVSSGRTPFPVTVVAAERGAIRGTVVYTGSVAAFNEEDVVARVTGRIVEMPIYPGDAVRPGQVLARLDDVELASRVREAAAGAAAARANVAQMDADVEGARHGVAQMERELAVATAEIAGASGGIEQAEREVAMAEAETEHQEHIVVREERLFAVGAVSQQDAEAARAAVSAGRAKVQAARARVQQSRATLAAAEARRDAARARLEQARSMEASAARKRDAMAAMATQSEAMQRTAEVVRDYVTIVAPSAGYVVKRLVAPGVLVHPGTAILKVAQLDRVRLQANVGERDLSRIAVGSPVTVSTTGTGPPPFEARVTAVFPFVDQGPRTAVVEAVVPNADRRLVAGQYVTMEFTTGERADTLTVPPSVLARLGKETTVWVVKDGRVERRRVETGLGSGQRVEITRGLAPGERVVARGHENLYAGALVTDVAADAPQPAGHDHGGGAPEAPTVPTKKGGPHAGH